MKVGVERIQKWLAARGVGSRREIEGWISEQRLRIDGKIAVLGQKMTGHERITLDGRPLKVSPELDAPRRVLMYHKPVGEVCTRKDPENRRDVFRALPRLRQGRWVSIGRLDLNTAGLLLFTTDGNLAHQLMHPSAQIEREYWVRVGGEVNEEVLERLRTGIMLEDGMAHFDEITPLLHLHEDDRQYNRYFSVVLKEGRNREVRRLWEAVGCQVSRLKRVRFGTIHLPKSLAAGRFVALTEAEVQSLMSLVRVKKVRDTRVRPR